MRQALIFPFVAATLAIACVDDLPVVPGDGGSAADGNAAGGDASADASSDGGGGADVVAVPCSNCTIGCCDNGRCNIAPNASVCGANGSACVTCAAQNVENPVCAPNGSCDYDTCKPGFVDVDGIRANGCETTAPNGVTEKATLYSWMQADAWDGSSKWTNSANASAPAQMTGTPPTPVSNTLNGHTILRFTANTSPPNMPWNTFDVHFAAGWSVFIVWNPASATPASGALLSFGSGNIFDDVRLEYPGNNDLALVICNDQQTCRSLVETGGWTTGWRVTTMLQDMNGNSSITDTLGHSITSTSFGPPADRAGYRNASYLAFDQYTQGRFIGDMAEIIMYWGGALSPSSATSVRTYLKTKYKL